MMIAMGKDPDAKPELSPELAAKMEADAQGKMSINDQVMWGGEPGREIRGKKVKQEEF